MSARERPLSAVPLWLWALLGTTLAVQIGLRAVGPPPAATAADLPPAPRAAALRAASLGEPAAAARLAMLYLQAFDLGAGNALPYSRLDYTRLRAWLRAIQDTDPRSAYPLFSAARVYAEVEDPARARAMLAFIHEAYREDPNRRWPALAHAALLAKHRLKDLPLARRYATDLQRLTTDPGVPLWAKQMEVFILEDMNELEAAKIMLGGMLASGRLEDPGERRFLKERLEELERRMASEQRRN
ncbi:MAG: hypothetical protein OEW90_14385 [Betaproteobacteria bacterium]|nr:hypothetical protein [Betaproteobacteria bacterium]MDH4325322.1 hypothetical protein [Betaproteobacteria bacterium]